MNSNPSPAALAGQSKQTSFLNMETISCPLCASENDRPVLSGKDHLHHIPGTFQIVRCNACRHAYLNPRPILADIIKCYPDEYGPHQPSPAANSLEPSAASNPAVRQPWYLRKWVRSIPGLRGFYYWLMNDWGFYLPDVAESSEKRALEIGCGTGQFLEKLRSTGWNATGVELAEQPAAIARNRGFEVHTGRLESAEFSAASFDAVHLYMVLEHVPHPTETLTEIYRLLEPGGWLVFSVPNFACWERFLLRDYSLGIELPRHLQHFSPATIRSLLKETHFEDVRI